ncbi:MAG: hypothetical protein A2186_00635 [Candidatus Levybacteria bacterium RIFOXYA1_FULL_41_10]|nr:MAG: hypothetical protein US02_C0011G0012 [Candidatus Levybacteria bacterium GW2011_GWA2_36_13]KKQ00432.1 MAG: hypothetical protein US07_C0012G0005 [Candidatus Levybacteria bacterium GW2011_GWB1_36_18]KKR16098.1 MAG: hypothetical protein UT44_C0019G0004 [Candidatus Levybacteria bacterium GW2011_GWA1_39_32]KKR51135.1 MAG: hypothetical protein UT87_C0008G0013 [Candidatus Levybacteria bacterium GW2011_GWC1_40_19]KKR73435.1 MAG: hypothetical protein UU15_C0010G0005 [Candidatus Levybacteria bacte
MISKEFIIKNWFIIAIASILLFSAVLRFYNYENRWGLAYDQAYSALVARYALDAGALPLVGPFSSAGPMQTGGEWYWFVMLGVIPYQGSVMTPWIFLTTTYLLFVLIIILLGKELISKKFGILLGILSLISTAQIAQSVSLTNQSPLALISLIAIWGMVKYVKTEKIIFLFIMGFAVSLAISFHLQGVALLALVISTLILGRVGMRGILSTLTGLFIPMIPLLLFDIKNNFVNSRSMIQYYLHDQYKISLDVLGRNWRTYAGIFWPNAWTHIVGGKSILGYLIISALALTTIYKFFKREINKEWQIIITSFIGMVTLLRYVRTPLYDSYVVFLHPFVFLLTGWVILLLYKRNRIIGFSLFTLIVVFSLLKDIDEINYNKTNMAADEGSVYLKLLTDKYPNQKFSVYAHRYEVADKNLILSLFLDSKNLIDEEGMGVGVVYGTESATMLYPSIYGEVPGLRMLDLSSSRASELKNSEWVNVNPRQIYTVTEEWYTK